MYLCRQMTPASLPEIATAFAKTHATILHGCRLIQNRILEVLELASESFFQHGESLVVTPALAQDLRPPAQELARHPRIGRAK